VRDERAVELVGGAYSGTGGWVNGEGYDGSYGSFTARVALVDSGIYDGTGPGNHPDHQSRVVAQTDYYGEQGQDIADHGTAVAGIVAGNADAAAGGTGLRDSLGYLWGQGMAPAAQLLNARDVDGFRGFGTTAWSTISTWVETNGGHEMSNSWGTVSWDAYTSDSQEWDAIVRDA